MSWSLFQLATRGPRNKTRIVEKWAFWPFLRDFKAFRTPNRCSRTPKSIKRYPRECRGPYSRLLPTAGVCDHRVGVSPRLLPTAGVCDRHVGATNRLLPTAGVCDQRVGVSPRLLPTTGVCDQGLGMTLRLLLTAGVCDRNSCACSLDFCPPQVYASSIQVCVP